MTARTTTGPLRVLYCIDHLAAGGAEQLLVRYLDHLHGGPVDAVVATMQSRDGNPLRADVEALGVPVTDLGIGRLRDADAGRKVRAVVAETRPDVVHTQLEFSNVLATRAAARAGVPTLATLHTLDTPAPFGRDGLRYRLMTRILRRHADLVVAVSESARRHHLERGRLDPARTATIHNGIDPDRFARGVGARVRLRQGIPGGAPVLATVAVHREPKGIQFMLDALPLVLARHPDAVYLLVGDGPHRAALEARAGALGVDDAVRFAGARRDVPDHLAAADVFVLPSLTEALPTVVAEAMAAALPVVATRVGGNPEMVVDDETGVLVPPSSPRALADAVAALLDDEALRTRFGAAGRARARASFSIRSQAGALLDEYRRLAGVGELAVTRITLVETDGSGGLVHYAYQLATSLGRCGAEVTLLTAPHYELAELPHEFAVEATVPMWRTTAAEPAWTRRLPAAVETVRLKLRRAWRAFRFVLAWRHITRRLLAQRPDIAQFSVIRFPFQVFFLRRLRRAGITLTQVCHEFEPRESGRLGRFAARRLGQGVYGEFDAIFFLGEAVKEAFHAEFPGIPADRCHVIPHGDESLFLQAADAGGDRRVRYGIPSESPVVGFFGGLRPSKGIDDLIDAFAAVRDEVPDAHLVVAGYPTDVDPLAFRARAAGLGLGDVVTIDDRYLPIEEVGPLLRSVDVVALPYRSGTASGALQVAYAFERPVVATDVGSVAEAVVDGETGLVVAPRDPDALARALIKLLADPAESIRMGIAGRRHAAREHAWEPIASRVLAVSEDATRRTP